MADMSVITNDFIKQEIEEFITKPHETKHILELYSHSRPLMQDIAAALIDGENDKVNVLTKQALDEGIDAIEVMDNGLIAGMAIVGIKFRDNFIFVPEVLACARAMKAGMVHIEPILSASGI